MMSVVYRGRSFSVEVGRTRFPNGQEHEVAVVRHPASVVLLPVTTDDRVILVRQYRPSVGRELWELPAGSLNPGETADVAAVRECEEEIGLVPGKLAQLRALYPAPGFCDEQLVFFLATELSQPLPNSTRHPDPDEDIFVQAFTVPDATAMVTSGEIADLKTAYGLTLLGINYRPGGTG